MSANFNYTGRIDIDPAVFTASIEEVDSEYFANVSWDLSTYGFADEAVIQLHISNLFEKLIDILGHAAASVGSKKINISALRLPLEATMTLKVVANDADGKPINLGWIKSFKPTVLGSEGGGRSLLETLPSSDLQVPWRLVTESGRPVLHISTRHDLNASMQNDELFDPIVIPAVLEQVFQWIIWDESDNRDDDILARWKKFFTELGATDGSFEELERTFDNQNQTLAWGRDLADEFTKREKILENLAKKYEGAN